MALAYSSDKVANKHLYPTAKPHSAREIYAVRFKATVDDQHEANDLIGLAILPPDCVPVGLEMYVDDIDGHADTPTITWDAGILNTDQDDLVASSLLIDGSTAGQSAGAQIVNDYEAIFEAATWLVEADAPGIHDEKIVAMKIIDAAAVAAAGDIYGVLFYTAVDFGV